MTADSTAAVANATAPQMQRLTGLLDKLLPFARIADALARRSVGKVRVLAMLSLLAALWIVYASVQAFEWSLAAASSALLVLVLPALVLWKIHGTLSSAVGLPQRILDTAARAHEKASEYRQYYESRVRSEAAPSKPKFRELWQAGKSLLQLKALGDEAREIMLVAGAALVLANPFFAIALVCASGAALLMALVAVIVALAYVF